MFVHGRWFLSVLLFAIAMMTCADAEPPCKPLSKMTDNEKLFLIDCVHLGSTEVELKNALPNEMEWKTRTSKEPGPRLVDHKIKTIVFGLPAELELSFSKGRLYAFFYSITTSAGTADSLYDVIVRTYSGRYKAPEVEHDRESDHDSKQSFWTQGDLNPVAARNEYANYSLLSWGFQNVLSPVNMSGQRK